MPQASNRPATRLHWIHALVAATPWPDGCIIFPGAIGSVGYGQVWRNGKQVGAHVAAYEAAFGPVPAGLMVLHGKARTCVSRACCNPAHLYAGDYIQNAADKQRDGTVPTGGWRGATGERHSSVTHPECIARGDRNGSRMHPERVAKGERQGHAKLTTADVLEIRAICTAGAVVADVARRFGMSHKGIRLIVARVNWKHIP